MNDSIKAANLGRCFPPWTVTRAAWHKALKPEVSGVLTDAVLFSENESQLVHHYRVFDQSMAHASLRGKFMPKLSLFTSGPAPMPSGRPSVTRSRGPGLRRHRAHRLAAFDPGDRTTNLRLVKLLRQYPRSYRKCQGPRHQRTSRQPRPMPGQSLRY